jgi:dipeptidyl aminopeptidase/acylaminoacyl peptidase
MKQASLLFLFLQLTVFAQEKEITQLVKENIPAIPKEITESLLRYQNTRSANLAGISPSSGQVLISTRFGETPQLHGLRIPMGARHQLTFFKEPVVSAVFCPDKKQAGFIFSKDEGGNEFTQLYWMDEHSGAFYQLTEGGRSQNTSPVFNNSGSQFAYSSTQRNQKDYDIYLGTMSANGPLKAKLLLEASGSWSVLDFSPDDQRLLLRHYISANRSELMIYELQSKTSRPVRVSEDEIAYAQAAFSADGNGLFICSDEATEFQTLKYLDLRTQKIKAITHSIRWDMSAFKLNKGRNRMAFTVNQNGVDKLYLMNTGDLKYEQIDGLPHGLITGLEFHPDGKTLFISLNNLQIPGDVFAVNIGDKKISRWTEGETGGLDLSYFPAAELITYPTFDEVSGVARQIPAFVIKPAHANGKLPVLISIHGGPEGQSRPAFNAFLSYLVHELGVVVILPNVRGSTGYGKSYLKMDNGFLREDAVKDIGKLLDWIGTQSDLDSDRIAVSGGSYGGYMSLACMAAFNNKLRCGIDVVGISNFVTFLKNTEDYRKDLRRVEYGDERQPDMNAFLNKISPLNHTTDITRPIFIVQGANDPRVPLSEAEQMKGKLLSQGNTVWYLMARDEGHGFRKKNNVDYYQWSSLLFLKTFLTDKK